MEKHRKTPLLSVAHARIWPEELIANQHISASLRHLGFTYDNQEMALVMEKIIDKHAANWYMKSEYRAIYKATMAMRVRCIMGKTGDIIKKKDPPSWTKQLKWLHTEMGFEVSDKSESNKFENAIEYEIEKEQENRKSRNKKSRKSKRSK